MVIVYTGDDGMLAQIQEYNLNVDGTERAIKFKWQTWLTLQTQLQI